MQTFPHHYAVAACCTPDGEVNLESDRLSVLHTAPPVEFGGPGDRWSPETLLVGAVADCIVLTFRAIARATGLPWLDIRCDVQGTLDRVERVTQFTAFAVRASLRVPSGTSEEKARRALERAEQTCLITNSLKAKSHLDATITIDS